MSISRKSKPRRSGVLICERNLLDDTGLAGGVVLTSGQTLNR